MKALGKNIVVQREQPQESTAGGIIYTDNSQATVALVISVGEEVTTVTTGDRLIINWGAANQVKYGGETVSIVHIDHVFAVV